MRNNKPIKVLVLRFSEYNSTNNMAASLDEKIAEAVRRFPVLYDKSCQEFKDNNTKKNAWEDVAKDSRTFIRYV